MFDAGGQVACPAGTVPCGGGIGFTGGIAGAGDNINTSAPTGNGWEGRYNNTSIRPDDHFAVVCRRQGEAAPMVHPGQPMMPFDAGHAEPCRTPNRRSFTGTPTSALAVGLACGFPGAGGPVAGGCG